MGGVAENRLGRWLPVMPGGESIVIRAGTDLRSVAKLLAPDKVAIMLREVAITKVAIRLRVMTAGRALDVE